MPENLREFSFFRNKKYSTVLGRETHICSRRFPDLKAQQMLSFRHLSRDFIALRPLVRIQKCLRRIVTSSRIRRAPHSVDGNIRTFDTFGICVEESRHRSHRCLNGAYMDASILSGGKGGAVQIAISVFGRHKFKPAYVASSAHGSIGANRIRRQKRTEVAKQRRSYLWIIPIERVFLVVTSNCFDFCG